MPFSLILKHPFNSLSLLPNIHVPLLAILAEKDAVVPLKNSLNLIKHYQGPQTRITIKDADHHDVESFPEYWEEIPQFLARTH
jgi:pimeloyl-ACP methyl ester carboxylesterase